MGRESVHKHRRAEVGRRVGEGGNRSMQERWVVLLEAAGDAARDPIGADALNRLHEALEPGRCGGVLRSLDRYALQVTATGAGPVDALVDVVARWADGVRRLGLPAWRLVRTEVFTPEDLEREFDSAERDPIGVQRPEDDFGPAHDEIGHELLHRAFSDPLTGLLGRHVFEHRLEGLLGGRRSAAVVALGLDGFEAVNRRFGEAAGNEAVIALARRLEAMHRPGDVLARLGGDEYGVLLEDSTEEAALPVAERMLHAVSLPMVVAGHDLTLSASAGVVVGQPGETAEAVLGNAGAALIVAKAAGGGRAVLYGSEVSRPGQTHQHFTPAALQDRRAQLQLLRLARMAGNEAETLDRAAGVVMRHICAQVGCAVGHLWISPAAFDETPQTSLWHMAEGSHDAALQEAAHELLASPGGLAPVVAGGRPVWIKDLHDNDDGLAHEQATAAGLRSAFAFPVLVGRDVVAMLAFFSRTAMAPTDSFLDVLVGIGTQLARVVERQRAAEGLRRAAEQLGASEARLREAEALTRLGSWRFDLRTGAGTWSEGTGALYGMDPRQPLDLRSALAAVHADDRPRIEGALSLMVEHGGSFADEIRVVRPDGQVRWHRAQGSAIRDDNGVVVAIQGTSQDITEAKLAQEALRQRERQLAEAQRAARLGCWELELSSGRLTWSEEMYRLWGWDPGQEITLDAFLATVDPGDRQRLLEAGARLSQTGEPTFVDFRATVAEGRQRWFSGEAHVLFDEHGTAIKLFGTDQDITEQKQAEEELRRAKDLYQRIIETTREGIVIVDAEDIITFVNPRMAEILGYSVDTMTGMAASSLVDEETRARLSGQQKRRREGMSEHYESQLLTKDGAVLHVLVSASPFMDDDGHYVGAVALVTDVTALREAEEILRSQTAEIQTGVDEEGRDEQAAS